MNNILVKDVFLKNSTISFEGFENLNQLYLLGENTLLKTKSENNTINIEELIKEYWYFFEERSYYTVCSGEEIKPIKVGKIKLDSSEYISKGATIVSGSKEYILDIYINEENKVKIEIQRELKGKSDRFLKIKGLAITEDYFEVDGVIEGEDNIKDIIAKPEIMLYGKEHNSTKISPSSIDKNSVKFHVDFKELPLDYKGKLNSLMILKDEALKIRFEEIVNFKNIDVEDEKSIKEISIKGEEGTGKLTININNKLYLTPEISHIDYGEDKLIFKGNLNSNLKIYDKSKVKPKIFAKISSMKGKKAERIEVLRNNDEFQFEVTKEFALNLKKQFHGKWQVLIEVLIEDEVVGKEYLYYENEKGTAFCSNIICESYKKGKNKDERSRLILNIESIFEKLTINPKVLDIAYEGDKLILNGKMGSSLDIYEDDSMEVVLKLIAKDGSITIGNNIKVVNDNFQFEINKIEIFDIKNAYAGEWHLAIEVMMKGISVVEEDVFYKNKDKNNGILLSEEIYGERDNTTVSAYLTKESRRFALKIKSRVTITQILSIYVKSDSLKVKYRTKEKVEGLLNSKNITTSIASCERELICSKVKKKGKKTYVCTYEGENMEKFMEEVLARGVKLYTTVDGEEFETIIPEINRYSVYHNMLEILQNTRKYKKLCVKLYNKIFLKMPVKKKRVLFESFLGRNVSGNPKYIYNYFVENGFDKKYELVWILNDLEEPIEGKCKKVKRKTIKYYYYMATAGYWVFNARQGDEIIKREKVTYLQTWHGTPYKTLGLDMFNSSMAGSSGIEEYHEKFVSNVRRWDYLLAQNDYSSEIFKRAFDFKEEMIEVGYPANDILYTANNKTNIDKLKDKFGLPKDKKVILYAPTWRDDNFYKKGHYKMAMELELNKLQEALGDEYIVVLRMHYLIANSLNIADYKGFAYDLSQGWDIQELYLISDTMITDYSSTMFDFGNLRRPMVFFAYDLEKYNGELRGSYFDLEQVAPGPVVKTTEEVIEAIKSVEEVKIKYKEKEEKFYKMFCHLDHGKAAKDVYDRVFK